MHKEVPEFVTYLYSLMENYKPPIDKDEKGCVYPTNKTKLCTIG